MILQKEPSARTDCVRLAQKYYEDDGVILEAAETFSPEQFLRLLVTAHGAKPLGQWLSHCYARFQDSQTGQEHFFLIPRETEEKTNKPHIAFDDNMLRIDDMQTNIRLQEIPHTTPFWYFHYDPNKENRPCEMLTLNLSPACPEKCVLCAGAKTGRVNNGMKNTLSPRVVMKNIFNQFPEAISQLNSVAIVTGCFNDFNALRWHLEEVRDAILPYCSPSEFRVLEHNIASSEQFDIIVRELGYDVFITLECFDQKVRDIALNGKVGRKGRDIHAFLAMIETYARFLDSHPELNKKIVRVTYLAGLDDLAVTEAYFQILAKINQKLQYTQIIPWLSIFTAYSKGMKNIRNADFSLRYLLDVIALSKKYFAEDVLEKESGGTCAGFARGLF